MITTKLICRKTDGLCIAAYSDGLTPEECLRALAGAHGDCFAVEIGKRGGFGCRYSEDGTMLAPPADPPVDPKAVEIETLRAKIKAKQGTPADALKSLELTL